jgi:hypothetical protein
VVRPAGFEVELFDLQLLKLFGLGRFEVGWITTVCLTRLPRPPDAFLSFVFSRLVAYPIRQAVQSIGSTSYVLMNAIECPLMKMAFVFTEDY